MLRVGTDCSGIEAPIQALLNMKVQFRHVFSCDADKYCRKSIEVNYHPEVMYDDMLKRNHAELPDVDLYICGFPCTPYSTLGLMKGSKDDRAGILDHCIQVILTKQPLAFILQNVPSFRRMDGGEQFRRVIGALEDTYQIEDHRLNTKRFGLPQNRERLYIIGIKRGACVRPCEVQYFSTSPKQSLDSILQDHKMYYDSPSPTVQRNVSSIRDPDPTKNYVATSQVFGGAIQPMQEMCPTLTTSSASSYWLTKYRRRFTPTEMLLLQGFPLSFKQNVSNTQLIRQAGNAMSVPVVGSVIEVVLRAVDKFTRVRNTEGV